MHGWRKGQNNPQIRALPAHPIPVPAALDLRTALANCMPTLRDQGDIGSCTAHGGVEMMGFVHRKLFSGDDPYFSALDLYAQTRLYENTPLSEDSGAQVADVCRVLQFRGVCVESLWPYDTTKFDQVPPEDATVDAKHHLALALYNCPGLPALKQSIAQRFPIVFGFDCYSSLETDAVAKTGYVPYPTQADQSIGGHCVLAVGYTANEVVFQNSWGPDWGDRGFGYLPFTYFVNGLATDMHTLRVETK